jgi:hypothetical protein
MLEGITCCYPLSPAATFLLRKVNELQKLQRKIQSNRKQSDQNEKLNTDIKNAKKKAKQKNFKAQKYKE